MPEALLKLAMASWAKLSCSCPTEAALPVNGPLMAILTEVVCAAASPVELMANSMATSTIKPSLTVSEPVDFDMKHFLRRILRTNKVILKRASSGRNGQNTQRTTRSLNNLERCGNDYRACNGQLIQVDQAGNPELA